MRHRRNLIVPVAAGLLVAGGVACSPREPLVSHASPTDDLAAATDAWHAERVAALTAPDGWLSLVTLAWLAPGPNRVGRDPAAAVAYAGLPADHVGTLHVDGDGGIRFEPAAGVAVTGVPDDGMLRTDADGPPTVVQVGRCRFEVIIRGGRPAVRMRDPEADSRVGFNGIERFPVDPAWSIEAAFEPAAGGEEVAVDSVIGVVDQTAVAGRARFEQGGRAVDLVLHPGGAEDRYFLVFGDATNGRETSGGGRFLLVERSGPGTVRLDFNRAYNPPCSFTDFATCPLPVPGNRLPFAVTAGERRYQRP
ncbi:MAG: DUF1684 domain-containing protein [Planctomycetota bacterium]|jgi:uncharacterized protein (DUF1684 family)